MPQERSTEEPSLFLQRAAALRRQLNELLEDVVYIYNYGKSNVGDPRSASESARANLKGMSRALDTHYNNFNSLWSQLSELHDLEKKSNEFPNKEDSQMKADLRKAYFSTCGLIEIVRNVDASTPRALDPNVTISESRSGRSLPKINLPVFDGQLLNWPKFRDTFVSLVHDDKQMSVMEKFHYLRTSLKGPALSVVACFRLDEANYSLAWKAVLAAYNNKRMLASAYLDKILNFKPLIGKASPDALTQFISNVSDHVAAFRMLEIPEESQFILFHLSIRCLDPCSRELFETSHNKPDSFPTFDQLSKFVRERSLALQLAGNKNPMSQEGAADTSRQTSKSNNLPKPKNYKSLSMVTTKSSDRLQKSISAGSALCICCKGEAHHLLSCLLFHQSSPKNRLDMLKGWSGCINCLSSTHKTADCTSRWHCRFCTERHHSSLHVPSTTTSCISTSPGTEGAFPPSLAANTHSQNIDEHVILGTAVAHILDAQGRFQSVRLVIDSGSQSSFLTERCVNRLGLKVLKGLRKISGIGQTIFEGVKGTTTCIIKPRIGASSHLVTEAIVVPSITSYLPTSILPKSIISKLDGIELADPTFWRPGPIDLLLGADLFTEIWTGRVKEVTNGGPKLFSSVFGFIVMGKVGQSSDSSTSLLSIDSCDDLNFQLERFWQLEEPTLTHEAIDPDAERAEDHFLKTHYRLESGRYGVRLPFKDDPPEVGDSSGIALRRFYNLERKFKINEAFADKYHEFLTEYLELGHMSLATTPAKFVIPHHGITKQGADGVKLKAVFDASVQVLGGSLNSHLLTGPKLQNDIRDVLLRFRHHRVAFTTDIVKMFRMIEVHPDDRVYTQIYWRFDPSTEVKRYTLNTVIYGLVCAPFLAQRVLKQLSADHGNDFPQAARALLKDSYVDDILTGAQSISEAINLREQLIELLKLGGFQLSKWSSSHQEILGNSTSRDPVDLSTLDEQWVKILGLQWDPSADQFSFSIGTPNPNHTKRGILSTVARLYDPLGFLSPTTLLMKSFIQLLWTHSVDWDQPLPLELQESWKSLIAELPLLSKVRVPRCLGCFADAISGCIVGFCDASSKGYAAVLYLIVETPNKRQISLITAKSKLAPIKTKSIPRLELSGALLLAELYSSTFTSICSQNLAMREPIFFTDSTIVLAWLNNSPHNLKVFVANRVAKVQELTPASAWRHVRSEDNPADPASRGILPSELLSNNLWWSGPSWLQEHWEEWPASAYDQPEDIPEIKAEVPSLTMVNRASHLHTWISRFSSFNTLVKAAGWLKRWLYNCRHVGCCCCSLRTGNLLRVEFEEGLLLCIKAVQAHHFPETAFVQKRFADLNPFLDQEGIWRVGGRLRHSLLPHAQKYPILLPHDSHFSALLVDYHHTIYLHPGPNTLQAVIQTKYWIPSLRRLIRHQGFKCLKCYKSKVKPIYPMMGDLPKFRVNGGRTFQHVGVDFAGPFQLKESNRRKAALSKVYLCLYVCMSTKAVHLEAVTRLTTEAFLACLQRFTSRRGIPTDIYSDCGSNFLGAANHLKELYRWFASQNTKEDLQDYAMRTRITWHFNPPQTPHMGGLWEAGVKSVKHHLRLVVGETPLTFEEITTCFAKIEAILNSRPLCPLSTSPEEVDYLSPGHFIVGGPLVVAPEPSVLDLKENLLSRWQLVNRMSESFWQRFRTEYLSTLQRRNKWQTGTLNLKVGDLVLLREPSPPLQWKLGRIVQVNPGADSVVRVVSIQLGKTVLKRHASQLVPLRHHSITSSS